MSDEEYEALVQELERVKRVYNTPELARQHLQELGMLDADGNLPEEYRSTACQ